MNRKTTKKALFSSVVALVLCFTTLLGTTFAWFTDTAKSAVNTIQAGTLDIALVDANGASLEGQTLGWVAADGRSQDNILWEPGCTYNTQAFYLKNNGNLALKYEIAINGITGDAKLLEAIDWTITVNNVETDLEELNGYLLANETTDAIVISGHMKEEAGNEYQGLSVENISITVLATQHTYEKDSFNDAYDKDATYPEIWDGTADISWYAENPDATEYTISTAEDLAALAAIVNGTVVSPVTTFATNSNNTIQDSFKGVTFILESDIDLQNIPWTSIGNWDNTFEGTFDGNGHVISNLYINEPTVEGVGLFGVAQNSTIKNVRIHNVDVVGYSMVGSVVGSPYVGCTISNCHVTGSVSLIADWAYVGGIASYGYVDIDNCSVIASGTGIITSNTRNAVGGIMAWLLENGNSITNCEVKNLNLTGWTNVGSIAGFVHYNNEISNCKAENIVLNKTRVDGNPGIGCLTGGWCYGENKTITIRNIELNNITLNGTHKAYDFEHRELYGSEYYGATTDIFVQDNVTVKNVTNNLTVNN